MSAFFASASSQRLSNVAATGFVMPFSVGFWFQPMAGGINQGLWALADTATTNNYFLVSLNTSDAFVIAAAAGGAQNSATGGAATFNDWNYVVARFISATSRRLSAIDAAGNVTEIQGTVSRAPAGVDRMSLGCADRDVPTGFFDGRIAEFWVASVDIQGADIAMSESLLRQLAYKGPFSVPHMRNSIVDYRSLKQYVSSIGEEFDDVFNGPVSTRIVWDNVNSVGRGPHAPQAANYQKLGDVSRLAMV